MEKKTPNTTPKVKKTKLEEWLDNPQRVLVAGAIVGIGGFLTYKLIRLIYSSIRSNSTSRQADDDPNVQAAMTIRTAMNPSGISWMRSFDLTNDDAIFAAAGTITDLDAVIKAYRKLYDADMLSDLQSELNADEYQKFMNIITANPNKQGGAAPVTWAPKNTMVVAKKEVTLRKTPDASYHGAFYEDPKGNNIITKVQPGTFIGYATGIQKMDTENNVKFIQVGYTIKGDAAPAAYKNLDKKKVLFWVSSSADYVETYTKYKPMFDMWPSTMPAINYKKPLDYFDPKPQPSGVSGTPMKAVVSRRRTPVLSEKLSPIATAETDTLLGAYLGSLDTGTKKYVRFLTIDGRERWADENNIKILD